MQWVLDFPLEPGCLSSNNHNFRGLPRSRLGSVPAEFGNCVCCVCMGVLHMAVLETATGNSGFRKQVLKAGVEAWSQRTCFELDPLRQRSQAAAQRTPAFSGQGHDPIPLSSSAQPTGRLFPPSLMVEMTLSSPAFPSSPIDTYLRSYKWIHSCKSGTSPSGVGGGGQMEH